MAVFSNHLDFHPGYHSTMIPELNDLLFIYKEEHIGLNAKFDLPLSSDIGFLGNVSYYCFGKINTQKRFLLSKTIDFSFLHYKLIKHSDSVLFASSYHAAMYGKHIHHWRASTFYCGLCSGQMLDKEGVCERYCQECHHIIYPKISPSIIVLITRGDEMLLARSPHFSPDLYSTIAGFIEPGESAEQAVVREIQEEIGIQVKEICYVASQPWPFPDTLMLGFTAKYASGEITIDHREIESAKWFNVYNLPTLPSKISIARYLIDRHIGRGDRI